MEKGQPPWPGKGQRKKGKAWDTREEKGESAAQGQTEWKIRKWNEPCHLSLSLDAPSCRTKKEGNHRDERNDRCRTQFHGTTCGCLLFSTWMFLLVASAGRIFPPRANGAIVTRFLQFYSHFNRTTPERFLNLPLFRGERSRVSKVIRLIKNLYNLGII